MADFDYMMMGRLFDRTHHNHNCLVPNVACG
jgi:hypothetical protein